MIYKCKNCGSALTYDINTKRLVCDYCKSSFSQEEAGESVLGESDDGSMMEQSIYVCKACGAKLMINNVESATYCAYCGQPTIVFDRIARMNRPDVIIPFSVTKEEAHANLSKRLKKGFFIPKEIKNIKIETIRGIYMPFMLYDISYSDRQVIKGSVKHGKRTCTEYFYRAARCCFKNMTVDASKQFLDDSSQRLEPYDTTVIKHFEPSYLSGFYADCCSDSPDCLKRTACRRATSLFNEGVMKDVDASSTELIYSNPAINVTGNRYGMLPAWFFVCNHEGKRYTVIVNGQTGKTIGAVPISKSKVIALSAILGTVLTTSFTLAGYYVCFLLDLESFVKFATITFAAIIGLFASAYKKYKRFKASRYLTEAHDTFTLVKDRAEAD